MAYRVGGGEFLLALCQLSQSLRNSIQHYHSNNSKVSCERGRQITGPCGTSSTAPAMPSSMGTQHLDVVLLGSSRKMDGDLREALSPGQSSRGPGELAGNVRASIRSTGGGVGKSLAAWVAWGVRQDPTEAAAGRFPLGLGLLVFGKIAKSQCCRHDHLSTIAACKKPFEAQMRTLRGRRASREEVAALNQVRQQLGWSQAVKKPNVALRSCTPASLGCPLAPGG